MGFRKGENKGNKFSVGHRASTRPDICTQTLISQLHEIDKDTKKEKLHLLCEQLIKLALGYQIKRGDTIVEVPPDIAAIREVIDRVQGRAPQAVELGRSEHPVVTRIERVIIDATEDAADRDAANLRTAH